LITLGSLVKRNLRAGKIRFAVPLNSAGRRALRKHHRLRLTLKLQIAPPAGAAQTIVKTLTLIRA
jgi:hypothetical protein